MEKTDFIEYVFMWCVTMEYKDSLQYPAEPRPVVDLLLSTEICPGTFAEGSLLDLLISTLEPVRCLCSWFGILFYFEDGDRIGFFFP